MFRLIYQFCLLNKQSYVIYLLEQCYLKISERIYISLSMGYLYAQHEVKTSQTKSLPSDLNWPLFNRAKHSKIRQYWLTTWRRLSQIACSIYPIEVGKFTRLKHFISLSMFLIKGNRGIPFIFRCLLRTRMFDLFAPIWQIIIVHGRERVKEFQ